MSKFPAAIIFSVVLSVSILVLTAAAQSTFEEKLNAEIDLILARRDITDVANERAGAKTSSIKELLTSITVFARAGQRDRVAKTLTQIASIPLSEQQVQQFGIRRIVRNAIDSQDLASLRRYYERFGSDEHTNEFVKLWRERGDTAELDAWLAERAAGNEDWWHHWFELRVSLGTESALIDELEADVRKDPADPYRLKKYLRAAGHSRDISWLVEMLPVAGSYNAYELASTLSPYRSDVALKLLERSLSLPFTSADRRAFNERAFQTAAAAPVISDPEKQLRYWTLSRLASLYKDAGHPELAQPCAERLAAMDTTGIQTGDTFGISGAVQMASGQRVIESHLLQNEAMDREKPRYWIERADYYRGRNETASAVAAYRQALDIFPNQKGDADANAKRLEILGALSRAYLPSQRQEIARMLRAELASLDGDPAQQFPVALMLISDYNDLVEEFFANNSRLVSLISARKEWGSDETYLIENILQSNDWKAEERTSLIKRLSALAQLDLKHRAYHLSKALAETDPAEVVTLLEMLRANMPKGVLPRDWNFNRESVDNILFTAYIESGQWRGAEKMYLQYHHYWDDELGAIAVAAARAGDIMDAVRLWSLNASLDRRKLEGLDVLAKTAAKPRLRELYLTIKRRDPLSAIPDTALAILN